jgi:HlyD family secretion protein
MRPTDLLQSKGRVAIAAVVIALAGGWLMLRPGAPTSSAAAAPAQTLSEANQAAARTRVQALGRIEPGSEVVTLTAPGPDRLESLLVQRGDTITKGQVLGYLATHAIAVAQRDAAKVQLKQATELGPLRVAAQRANVAALQTQLDNSRDILKSQSALREKDFVARRTLDDQQALVRQQEAGLRSAQALLDQTERQSELDRLTAEAALGSAEATVSLSELHSPIDGQVLNVLIQPGGPVNGQAILTLGDTAHMRAVAEIYETDVGLVRVGQTAHVTSAAIPGPLTGKVVEIGHMVFKNDVLNVDPAARADARVVEVRIALDDSAPVKAFTNLTVDVAIDLGAGAASRAAAKP